MVTNEIRTHHNRLRNRSDTRHLYCTRHHLYLNSARHGQVQEKQKNAEYRNENFPSEKYFSAENNNSVKFSILLYHHLGLEPQFSSIDEDIAYILETTKKCVEKIETCT